MFVFFILYKISFTCILIVIRCEAPWTIMDVALYEIKYIIIYKSMSWHAHAQYNNFPQLYL